MHEIILFSKFEGIPIRNSFFNYSKSLHLSVLEMANKCTLIITIIIIYKNEILMLQDSSMKRLYISIASIYFLILFVRLH